MVTPDRRVSPDFAVARDGPTILDYFLLPATEARNGFIGVDRKAAHEWVDRYRYSTLALGAVRRARGDRMVPRMTTNLAKRGRRVLGIKRRLDAQRS